MIKYNGENMNHYNKVYVGDVWKVKLLPGKNSHSRVFGGVMPKELNDKHDSDRVFMADDEPFEIMEYLGPWDQAPQWGDFVYVKIKNRFESKFDIVQVGVSDILLTCDLITRLTSSCN